MVTPTPTASQLGSIIVDKWPGEFSQFATAFSEILLGSVTVNTVRLEPKPWGYPDAATVSHSTRLLCLVYRYGDHSDDEVKATLTLYQGSTYVDSWSNSGIDSVSVYGESKVKSGKSYTLKLTYSVNGVSKPAVSTTATCP